MVVLLLHRLIRTNGCILRLADWRVGGVVRNWSAPPLQRVSGTLPHRSRTRIESPLNKSASVLPAQQQHLGSNSGGNSRTAQTSLFSSLSKGHPKGPVGSTWKPMLSSCMRFLRITSSARDDT